MMTQTYLDNFTLLVIISAICLAAMLMGMTIYTIIHNHKEAKRQIGVYKENLNSDLQKCGMLTLTPEEKQKLKARRQALQER